MIDWALDCLNGVAGGGLAALCGLFLVSLGKRIGESSKSRRDAYLGVLIGSLIFAAVAAAPRTEGSYYDEPLFRGVDGGEVSHSSYPLRTFSYAFVVCLAGIGYGVRISPNIGHE
jgi:hypothetical protein